MENNKDLKVSTEDKELHPNLEGEITETKEEEISKYTILTCKFVIILFIFTTVFIILSYIRPDNIHILVGFLIKLRVIPYLFGLVLFYLIITSRFSKSETQDDVTLVMLKMLFWRCVIIFANIQFILHLFKTINY